MKILLKPKSYWRWILMFVLLWPTVGLAEDPKVIKIIGKAEILKVAEAQTQQAAVGQQLQPGDKLRVSGKGLVIIRQPNVVTNAWVTHDSELEYLGKDRSDQTGKFAVPQGIIYFEIKKGSKLDVQTTHLVASVRGTEFITHAKSNESHVRVISGKVKVSDPSGKNEMLRGGMRISATKNGLGLKANKKTLKVAPKKSFFSRVKKILKKPANKRRGMERKYKTTDHQKTSRSAIKGRSVGRRSNEKNSKGSSVSSRDRDSNDSKGGKSGSKNDSSSVDGSGGKGSSESNSGSKSTKGGKSGSKNSGGNKSKSGSSSGNNNYDDDDDDDDD